MASCGLNFHWALILNSDDVREYAYKSHKRSGLIEKTHNAFMVGCGLILARF